MVEQGSFTAAARRLGISTAQVSRQVSALEARLATRLLYRTTRRVTVTEAGQLYYRLCRQALDLSQRPGQVILQSYYVPLESKLALHLVQGARLPEQGGESLAFVLALASARSRHTQVLTR